MFCYCYPCSQLLNRPKFYKIPVSVWLFLLHMGPNNFKLGNPFNSVMLLSCLQFKSLGCKQFPWTIWLKKSSTYPKYTCGKLFALGLCNPKISQNFVLKHPSQWKTKVNFKLGFLLFCFGQKSFSLLKSLSCLLNI